MNYQRKYHYTDADGVLSNEMRGSFTLSIDR